MDIFGFGIQAFNNVSQFSALYEFSRKYTSHHGRLFIYTKLKNLGICFQDFLLCFFLELIKYNIKMLGTPWSSHLFSEDE